MCIQRVFRVYVAREAVISIDLIDYHVDKNVSISCCLLFKQIPKSVNVTARLFCETLKLKSGVKMFLIEQQKQNRRLQQSQ